MIVNAFIHSLFSVRDVRQGKDIYNPGLLTGVALMLPSGCFALRALQRQGILTIGGIVRVIFIGIIAHVGLLGSLRLRAFGKIGDPVFLLLETIDFLGVLSLSMP